MPMASSQHPAGTEYGDYFALKEQVIGTCIPDAFRRIQLTSKANAYLIAEHAERDKFDRDDHGCLRGSFQIITSLAEPDKNTPYVGINNFMAILIYQVFGKKALYVAGGRAHENLTGALRNLHYVTADTISNISHRLENGPGDMFIRMEGGLFRRPLLGP